MQLVTVIRAVFFSLLMLPLAACAESGAEGSPEYKAGEHYQILPRVIKTRDASKIEVVELFWYGCGHCYTFEPMLQKWAEELPADVDFWQSPAMWRDVMVLHARAFYVADYLKVGEKMHMAIFEALNRDRNPLQDQAAIRKLFVANGVDAEAFDKAFDSFAVTSSTRLADARARNYKITGTPEMVVNGKYRISGRMAGSQQGMLKVASYLIAKERAAGK